MKKIFYLLFICLFIFGISFMAVSQKVHAQTSPSPQITASPTEIPTVLPTALPTAVPTVVLTGVPTTLPTILPTVLPTVSPTIACLPLPTNTGSVTTTITLGNSTKYAIWSRIMAPNTNAAAYYLVIDNQCGIKVGGNSLGTNIWTWVGYSDGLPANRVILSLTAGSHIVKMIGDTANLGIDKIIFTPDMSCVPTGTGSNCNQIVTPTVVATATGTPTGSQSSTPAPTGATTTPIAPTVTGPIPTDTPAPTATPVPGTQFAITVLVHGVGHGGDNVAPDSEGNNAPIHIQRTAAVQIYDSNNTLIASPTGTVTFDPHTGTYKGIIAVGRALPAGAYITKIIIAHHLNKTAVKIVTITAGEPQPIVLDAAQMIAGDLNGDGRLNIQDFNIIMGCVSDLGPAKACTADEKQAADINDDGVVDLSDLNLYFREIAVQSGQ